MTSAELSKKRAAAGRLGGLTTSSRHDPRELTKAGTAAFLRRFEIEVDPDGALSEAERARRAVAARRLYFARLAARSAEARRPRGR